MRKKIASLLLFFISLFFILICLKHYSDSKSAKITINNIQELRDKHAQYLENSPFKETLKLTKEERKAKGIPPNKYYEDQWLLTMNPRTGRPEPEDVLNLQQELNKLDLSRKVPGTIDNQWEDRGPNNVGGRTRVVFFDPNDSSHKRVFAGGVSGGLWYTNDIEDVNASWYAVEDVPGNMNVSSYTIDPRDPNIWYIGTGEYYTSGAAVGNGIYKSVDGGNSWIHVPILDSDGNEFGVTDNPDVAIGIYFITDIVAWDNGESTDLFIGVAENYNRDVIGKGFKYHYLGEGTKGLYKSVDGGQIWNRIKHDLFWPGSNKDIPNDFEIAPDNSIWFSTFNSTNLGIFRSTDGIDWVQQATLPLERALRVEIDFSSTNSEKLYVLVYNGSSRIFLSEDMGGSFIELASPSDADLGIAEHDFTRGQGWYNLVIEVDPNNDDIFYVGGIDLFRTNKGGNTSSADDWQQISKWIDYGVLGELNCSYVHADQHAFVFHPEDSNVAVIGCDGGVFLGTDLKNAADNDVFIERNKGYNVTQFYYGSIGQNPNNELFLAGAQDNGSQFINNGTQGTNSSIEVSGGDGVYTTIDKDGDYMITSYQYGRYMMHKLPYTGEFKNVNNGGGLFINPAGLDHNKNILYASATNSQIYRYILGGEKIEQELLENRDFNGMISAFKVSPFEKNQSTLYAGSRVGKLLKATNADSNVNEILWEDLTGPEFLGSISDIEFGKTKDDIFVTFTSYGVVNIWYSANGGITWHNKDGNLPNMPVRCILQNPLSTNEVIIGTELGVWRTTNFNEDSPIWERSFNGMRDVKVVDLDLRIEDNTVLATTHGRGLFTGKFTEISENTFTMISENNVVNACKPNDTIFEVAIKFKGGFSEAIDFSLEGIPEESKVTMSQQKNESGLTLEIGLEDLEFVPVGTYPITLIGDANTKDIKQDLILNVMSPEVGKIILTDPIVNNEAVTYKNTNLRWEKDQNAGKYEVEIALDAEFQEIFERSYTQENLYVMNKDLELSETYFWRVRGLNTCAMGDYSEVGYLSTYADCRTQYGTIELPDLGPVGPYEYEFSLNFKEDKQIGDINVFVNLNVSDIQKYIISLISPSGTEVKLFDVDCDLIINYLMAAVFDDQAKSKMECGYSAFGEVKPFEPLTAFKGENAFGEWKLKIISSSIIFNFYEWNIEICNDKPSIKPDLLSRAIKVPENSMYPVLQNKLKVNYEGVKPSEWEYFLNAPPGIGKLFLNDQELKFGSRFSQLDINSGKIFYSSPKNGTQSDQFNLNIRSVQGYSVNGVVVEVEIDKDFKDSDFDGIHDNKDQCLETEFNTVVDKNGCFINQFDDDEDGIFNDVDECMDSEFGIRSNKFGCKLVEHAFWGVTAHSDGSTRSGQIYRIDINDFKFESVFEFTKSTTGEFPLGGLTIAENGKMYGVCKLGSEKGRGNLYEFNPTTNQVKILHLFNSYGFPDSELILHNNKLYGTTLGGNEVIGDGVIFEFDLGTHEFRILHRFSGGMNGFERSNKMVLVDENLYGIARFGGTYDHGMLYKFNLIDDSFQHIYSLNSEKMQFFNGSGLMQASNGLIYGWFVVGGENDEGFIFEYDPVNDNFVKKLDGKDESLNLNSFGYFTEATNGKLYAAATVRGPTYNGNIFEYDISTNTYNSVWNTNYRYTYLGLQGSFQPGSILYQASDKKLYGYIRGSKGTDMNALFNFDIEKKEYYEYHYFENSYRGNSIINLYSNNHLVEYNLNDYDSDADGVLDIDDNCPHTSNSDQVDYDGDGIGDVCDDDIDGDGILNEEDNCPEISNEDQSDKDGDGFGDVCDDDLDNDGVLNDEDNCPETPNESQEDLDDDGIGDACDDDIDGDGVLNESDYCNFSTLGGVVDANGCFSVSEDNFSIALMSETCPEKANGSINITAKDTYNYMASINGTNQTFTNELFIGGLAPGYYDLCISVEGEDFEQCYNLEIEAGITISGKSSTTAKKTSIDILEGTAPFNVSINGKEVLETHASSFDLNVDHGDRVEVKTKIACEGVYAKTIDLFDKIQLQPNPTTGVFDVLVPLNLKEVPIEIYSSNAQLISSKTYPVVAGKVQMDIRSQQSGVYLVKVMTESPVSLKVVKR